MTDLRRHLPVGRAAALGMSLVEAIASIAIMAIIMIVVDQVFIVNQDILAKQLVRADNDNGAVSAIKRLGELTRGASAVLVSYTINGTNYITSPTTLVIRIPSVNSSGNIVSSTSYDYLAVYRDSTDSTKIYTDTQTATGSARVSGQHLLTAYNSILTFSYNNSSTPQATRVSVYLVNQQTVRSTTQTTKAWTSIFLRNY
jgi:hypothetical protein